MKKNTVIFVFLIISVSIANAQQLSSEQQEIINRQQAEIQQIRNSAQEYQAKAEEAGRKCEQMKNMKDPGENVKSITFLISKYCGEQETYQRKANELYVKANEKQRLLNEAIKEAKENERKPKI